MKVELVVTILVLIIGLGYSFRITDLFSDSTYHDTQRQSTIEDQILPVFTIAFFASLFNSLVFGLKLEGLNCILQVVSLAKNTHVLLKLQELKYEFKAHLQ